MRDEAVLRALADAGLTPREREVFRLVADRLRNREIAEHLYISERTVESHVASMLRKLGGSDRTDLIELGSDLRERVGDDRELPQVLSSFVGRTDEIGELSEFVRANRLVALTGPGGVGKTRLAFQVARSLPDMASPILVDLATVTASEEVDRSFANALGLVEDDHGLRDSLRAAVRDDRHLLVVDNCEHVRAGVAALLGDLLSAAAQLHVLATSRSPLQIAGEVVYEIAPLGIPPESDDPAVVLAEPSARLFVDRAVTASPGFEITPDNARAIADICRRLDGLPLAIELAAARIRTFSPSELLANLVHRFQVLDVGPLAGAARHRSLEAALRWSYDLLGTDERVVFERCSVFAGEFDYDTAAAVMVFPPIGPDDFARAFPRLLDRSLLSRRRLGDQTTAYRMLETFRAFAAQQLEGHGGAEEVGRRHAVHHLEAAVARSPDLRGGEQLSALRWFDRRWVDLRAAMRWALGRDENERAWMLLTSVGRGWDTIGIRGELFDWLEELLARPLPDGDLGVRARITAASLLFYLDAVRAVEVASEALELVPATDTRLRAGAELTLGWALGYLGDRQAATEHLGSALERFRQLDDPWLEAITLQGLGHAAQDPASMTDHLEAAAAMFARRQDDALRINCLNMMASRAVEMGIDDERVEGWLAEAHRTAERTGNEHERLHAELHRARLEQNRGHHAPAVSAFRELLPTLRRIGDRRCATRCLLGMGWGALTSGDHSAAREDLTAGVMLADRLNDPRELATGLRLLSLLEHEEGRSGVAAALLGAASSAEHHLDRARRVGLPDTGPLRERLSEHLGPEDFQHEFERGRQIEPGRILAPL